MGNVHLQCHCGVLVANITTFLYTINNCSCKPDHRDFKKEQRYLKKLDKQLKKVIHLLNNSP